MRCQGKMICHAVRWCTLYFTVHFSVILSPVARKESAWGGWRMGLFPYAPKESLELCSSKYLASLTLPSSLLEKHKTNCLLFSHFCNTSFSISPKKLSKREIYPLQEASIRQIAPKILCEVCEPARQIPCRCTTCQRTTNPVTTGGVSWPHTSINATNCWRGKQIISHISILYKVEFYLLVMHLDCFNSYRTI